MIQIAQSFVTELGLKLKDKPAAIPTGRQLEFTVHPPDDELTMFAAWENAEILELQE